MCNGSPGNVWRSPPAASLGRMRLDPGAGDREVENTDLTFIHRVEKREVV